MDDAPPSSVRLYSIVVCGNLCSFALGTTIGWTSPMMPKLRYQYEDSPFNYKINVSQEGWIFSLIAIGSFSSACIAGPTADRIGRKTTLLFSSTCFFTSYIMMLLLTRIEVMYAARILQGVGASTTMTVLPLYVGEISTTKLRGSTGGLMTLFLALGMLYVYCIGPFTSYTVLQLCCIAVPLCFYVGSTLMPESPHYLISKGDIPGAIDALKRVRLQSIERVLLELPAIIIAVERAKNKGKCMDLLRDRGNRRALKIVVGVMSFQQFSGAVIIVINSQSIFMDTNCKLDAATSSIIVGIVQAVCSFALQFVVDIWTRRKLLRISAFGMGISQFATGTFFFIKRYGDASEIQWIPVLAFNVFQLAYRIGFGPMPFIILSELFPPNVKAIAAATVTTTCWGLGFTITRSYPHLDAYGHHYIFWAFSVGCFFAFLFVQYVVMETSGLTFEEIQIRLRSK